MTNAELTAIVLALAAVAGVIGQVVAVGRWQGRVDATIESIKDDIERAVANHDGLTAKLDQLLSAVGELRGMLRDRDRRGHDGG